MKLLIPVVSTLAVVLLHGCGGSTWMDGFEDGVEEDHRNLFVDGFYPTGTSVYPSCSDDTGERLHGLFEDCTDKDFFVWKGDVQEDFTPPTYTGHGSDALWSTIPVNQIGGWQAHCVAYVTTDGETCNQWCAARDLVCQKGMDDAHHQTADLSTWLGDAATDCSLSPVSSARADQSDNGCNAVWTTQVCACAQKRQPIQYGFFMARQEPYNQLCSWPDNGQLTNGLPPLAVEDCSHGDFHAYKGLVRDTTVPSYPANTYGSDDIWSTIRVEERIPAFKDACVAHVKWGEDVTKDTGTCADWCASVGMTCVGGMDDAHWQNLDLEPWLAVSGLPPTKCTLYPGGHHRQTGDENGCQQSWHTHICACKHSP